MALHTLTWSGHPPVTLTGGAVTVGNFDGVHRGHQRLLETARANAGGGSTVAVTFDPPPVALLNPAVLGPPLTTLETRATLLEKAGADHVVVLQVTAALLALSPEAFFEDMLVRQLRAKAVVEGHDFRFGRARLGDVTLLKQLCADAGVRFAEVVPLLDGDAPVSSSRIRTALTTGDVTTAATLLGRSYRISGTVITGAKRGRTLGFPTANLDAVDTLLPGVGVYAVQAIVDGQPRPAAANIGPNPTFGETARKIEVHLIDFTSDLYGRTLAVDFVAKLRDTKPFAGIDALTTQLKRDIAAARHICGAYP